jgi:hypothetical protein
LENMNKKYCILFIYVLIMTTRSFSSVDTIGNDIKDETNIENQGNKSHFILESLSGTGCGLLLGTTGFLGGYSVTKNKNQYYGGYLGAFIGASIGYTLGNSIGVCLVGNKYHEKGSVILSILGSIGLYTLGVVIVNANQNTNNVVIQPVDFLVLTLPIIGSSIGYHIGSITNTKYTKIKQPNNGF